MKDLIALFVILSTGIGQAILVVFLLAMILPSCFIKFFSFILFLLVIALFVNLVITVIK